VVTDSSGTLNSLVVVLNTDRATPTPASWWAPAAVGRHAYVPHDVLVCLLCYRCEPVAWCSICMPAGVHTQCAHLLVPPVHQEDHAVFMMMIYNQRLTAIPAVSLAPTAASHSPCQHMLCPPNHLADCSHTCRRTGTHLACQHMLCPPDQQ
jgi:hypothetical protein